MQKDGYVMEKQHFFQKKLKCGIKLKILGFIDSWRKQNPEEGSIYSWFDYRSRMFDDNPKRGLRIDHILLSENLEHAMLGYWNRLFCQSNGKAI